MPDDFDARSIQSCGQPVPATDADVEPVHSAAKPGGLATGAEWRHVPV